jgi:Pyruvate dehydrogenase complex, dehydrogenase (E1) component
MQNPEFEKEFQEWLEALENVLISDGKEYTEELLRALYTEARLKGIEIPKLNNPPFKIQFIQMKNILIQET